MTVKVTPRWSPGWCLSYTYSDSTLLAITNMTNVWQWTDSFVGGEFPAYKLFISKGWNATTGAIGVRISFSPGTGHAELEYEQISFGQLHRRLIRRNGAILASTTPFPAVDTSNFDASEAESQARLRFLQNYRSVRTAFQSGTFFGEIAETLRMLKSPAHALRKGIDSYFETVKKRTRRVARPRRNAVVQDTYLEYTYGWRPLVNDISDAYQLLKGGPDSYRKVISGSSNVVISSDTIREQADAADGLVIFYTRRGTRNTFVRFKGAVNADFEEPPSLAEFTGLGLSNFLPTVWNLIPYSFLVDYFSTIGQVIDAASLGIINLSWGCKTTRKYFKYEVSDLDLVWSPVSGERLIHKSVSLSGYSGEQSSFTRASFDQIYAVERDLRFRIPGVESPWKWLNIAALAGSRVLPF